MADEWRGEEYGHWRTGYTCRQQSRLAWCSKTEEADAAIQNVKALQARIDLATNEAIKQIVFNQLLALDAKQQ